MASNPTTQRTTVCAWKVEPFLSWRMRHPIDVKFNTVKVRGLSNVGEGITPPRPKKFSFSYSNKNLGKEEGKTFIFHATLAIVG